MSDRMRIQIGDLDLQMDFSRVSIRDLLACMPDDTRDHRQIWDNTTAMNVKVLGDGYLDIPLLYVPTVNRRVMEEAVRLFTGVDDIFG